MTGLVQEYVFKENLRNCEPIDFSRFAVDLRERDTSWSFGPPILMAAHESTTQQNYHFSPTTYNRWCALPPNKTLATRSAYKFPKFIFLDLPRDVIRSVARFRLRVHTLRFETATWNPRSSPACDLCEANDDVQDEQHANFHCTHPHTVFLRREI